MTRDKRPAILQVREASSAGSTSRVPRLREPCSSVASRATPANWRAIHDEARAAGFDGIEVLLGFLARPAAPGDEPTIHTTLAQLEDAGIHVKVVATGCACCDLDTVLAELMPLLRRAAGVGASCLNFTIPLVLEGRTAPEAQVFTNYQDALNFAYQVLHHARFEAEATGVAIALEAAAEGCLLSPVELREIVDDANSWAVGACIDVARVRRVGSPADWITTLGHRVHAVRWHALTPDAGAGPSRSEHVDVEDLAHALETIGYERPVIATATDALPVLSPSLQRLCGRVG